MSKFLIFLIGGSVVTLSSYWLDLKNIAATIVGFIVGVITAWIMEDINYYAKH